MMALLIPFSLCIAPVDYESDDTLFGLPIFFGIDLPIKINQYLILTAGRVVIYG